MANKNVNDAAEILAANNLQPSSDPDLASMQKSLLELQYDDLREQIEDKKEKKRVEMEVRKQGALSMAKRQEQQEAIQAACPHMKPNNQPAIAGQRDHQRDYHFICAYCAKEFTHKTLPVFLRIPSSYIGGPEV